MREYDLIIVGGGASGILCAIEASKCGINNTLLIEKDPILGGALNLSNYNISRVNNLTGQEYKVDLLKELNNCNIEVQLNTMVLKIDDIKEVLCTSPENGIEKIKGKVIILANGSKEASRKAINMVGDRCSGILTVGMAKKIFAIDNMIPGKNILIDGNSRLYMLEKELKNNNINIVGIISEDENTKTYGLTDKVYKDYKISSIEGNGRISCVKLSKDGKEELVNCDTLIFARPMLSDGIVAMRSGIDLNTETTGPKVDDRLMTSKEGIFACGNGIYIHKYIEDIEEECSKLVQEISKLFILN